MAADTQTQQTVLGNVKDQPETLRAAFTSRADFVGPFVEALRSGPVSRIVFLGSGTSYNVATMAASYFSRIAGIDSAAPYPTEFQHYGAGVNTAGTDPSSVLCVGISQSGTSISTCEALEHAKAKGYRTLALTSEPGSHITSLAGVTTPMLVGEELTGPETKGYTVSLMTVYLWAVEAAKTVGALSPDAASEAVAATERVTSRFDTVVRESEEWYDRNRPSLLHSSRINILGYGADYGTMLEAVLKVSEMLRVPTIGNLLEEHGHGPTYALKFDHAHLFIGSDEVEFERMLQFREQLGRHAPGVHAITCREFDSDERDLVFSVKADRFLAPLMYTVPFQFLAAKGGKDVFIDTNVNPVPVRLGHYATS